MVADFFVLSLEGCDTRRGRLLDALAALGITPQVPAAEALLDRKEANRRAKRIVTDAEFACALSHLAVYRAILQRGCELAVILEDDARLTDDFLETVSALVGHEFDIALLDHEFVRSHWSAEFELPTGAKAWRVMNIPDRNTGYLLTAKAARHLLDHSYPLRYLADWPFDIAALHTVALRPKAVLRPRRDHESLLAAVRKLSQAKATWGNPSPPYSDTDVSSRLRRFLSRRIS